MKLRAAEGTFAEETKYVFYNAQVNFTGNHVLYRVIPCYTGDDLLGAGVLMEAYSVEDNGRGLASNVFVFHIPPREQPAETGIREKDIRKAQNDTAAEMKEDRKAEQQVLP